MNINNVRNIAPFINEVFTITSPWWSERVNPITGETEIHRGLDISTGTNSVVYSMLDGVVHSKGTDASMGNWVIIWDNNAPSDTYGYATLYMHLKDPVSLEVNSLVQKNMPVGIEGSTGEATGIHLHVEMQNISRFNNQWHWSYTKSDYLDPTVYMGIDNIDDTSWIYNQLPPTPTQSKYKKFPWFIVYRKKRIHRKMI